MKRAKATLMSLLVIILIVGAGSGAMYLSPVNHDAAVPKLQPSVVGSTRLLVVSSGSMCQRLTNPSTGKCTLAIGDLIVTGSQDPSTIVASCASASCTTAPTGSIIVFRIPAPFSNDPNYLVVHRVVAKHLIGNEYFFDTRGDANGGACNCPSANDPWDSYMGVPASNIVGVYQYTVPIPYLGLIILAIQNFISRLRGS